jgi:hypothetical protein
VAGARLFCSMQRSSRVSNRKFDFGKVTGD